MVKFLGMDISELFLSIIQWILTPLTNKFLEQINKNPDVLKIINLYKQNEFVKIRFWDAPFLEVEKLIPKKADIMDIGCGEGIFTNYIALKSSRRQVIGVEIDKNRLRLANKDLKNTKFIYGNANKFDPPRQDIFIMFHLLHHLKSKIAQDSLIDTCVNKLPKNGKLIIVEVDQNYSPKYFLAWLVDHILVSILFEKKFYERNINFRKKIDWINFLKSRALKVKTFDMSKNSPFPHITILAIK